MVSSTGVVLWGDCLIREGDGDGYGALRSSPFDDGAVDVGLTPERVKNISKIKRHSSALVAFAKRRCKSRKSASEAIDVGAGAKFSAGRVGIGASLLSFETGLGTGLRTGGGILGGGSGGVWVSGIEGLECNGFGIPFPLT